MIKLYFYNLSIKPLRGVLFCGKSVIIGKTNIGVLN